MFTKNHHQNDVLVSRKKENLTDPNFTISWHTRFTKIYTHFLYREFLKECTEIDIDLLLSCIDKKGTFLEKNHLQTINTVFLQTLTESKNSRAWKVGLLNDDKYSLRVNKTTARPMRTHSTHMHITTLSAAHFHSCFIDRQKRMSVKQSWIYTHVVSLIVSPYQ